MQFSIDLKIRQEFKMKSAAAILSFVCAIASFQSCYGIKCYECFSKNFEEPECDKFLDQEYLIPCDEPNSVCYKIWYLTGPPQEYGVLRKCGTKEYLINLERTMTRNAYRLGSNYGLIICNTDGCNGV